MKATLAAVRASNLNAISYIDEEGALARAARADVSKPFGGVPPLHDVVSREELRLILQMSRAGSDVEAHERVMVRRAFSFGEKKVADRFKVRLDRLMLVKLSVEISA